VHALDHAPSPREARISSSDLGPCGASDANDSRAIAPMKTAAKFTLAISTLAGSVLAAAILRARAHEHYKVFDKRREMELLLLARQLEPRGLASIVPGAGAETRLNREPIDRAVAEKLFTADETVVYDPITIYRHASNLNQTLPLDEYPGGKYVRRTNSAGEREDHDTDLDHADVFVLVAGDSHVDGVCENPETFPNRIEAELARSRPGSTVEVLNTGTAGYGPYHYLAVLEKYLPHSPRVFVVALFGGNDFHDVLHLRHFYDHTLAPKVDHDGWTRMQRDLGIGRAELLQGVNQMLHFKRNPDEAALSLETCRQVFVEIDRQCKARGIPWIFVYIPSVFDGPWTEHRDVRDHCRETLGLTEWDLGVDNRLADALIATLRERGVDVLDLRPVFAAETGPWYWSELHIDVKAHARIGELLAPRVEAALRASTLSTGTRDAR
jgi:hypothetical protein